MLWEKKGLIYAPDQNFWWSQHYGILPTPVYLPEKEVIRVYFGTTDKDNIGRISSLDVSANKPSAIIVNTKEILLDAGEKGCFDDCGIIPSNIINFNGEQYLYYTGYQRTYQLPYLLLSGIAKIMPSGQLLRLQKTPVLERTPQELTIRSAMTVLAQNGILKSWYVSAYNWQTINSSIYEHKLLPT